MRAHRLGIGLEATCVTPCPAGAILADGPNDPAPQVSRPPATDPVADYLATQEHPHDRS